MDKRKRNRRPERAPRAKAARGRGNEPTTSPDRYLGESKPLAQHLQRLAQAIAASSPAPVTARLSCHECEAMLEFCLDAEGRGEPAQDDYPSVYEHLRTCARCRLSYRLLTESLREDPSADVSAVSAAASPLPFLAPPASESPWTIIERPRLAGAPANFGVAIQAWYLRQRLSETQPAVLVRGKLMPGKRTLVLSDTVSLSGRKVAVKLWVQRREDSTLVRLEIQLASSAPLPEPLHVHVSWNGRTESGVVRAGKYSLDGIPFSALEGERPLRIEFQADDPPVHSVEGPGGDLR